MQNFIEFLKYYTKQTFCLAILFIHEMTSDKLKKMLYDFAMHKEKCIFYLNA